MNKHIVITTYGTLGDLHPYIAIAIELKQRGHEVVIATSELYRSKIEVEGIEFYAVRPNFEPGQNIEVFRRATDSREGLKYLICELILPHIRDTYSDLMQAVNGADLLVTQHLSFAGPVVAEKTGIRWISSVLAPILISSAHDSLVLSDPFNQIQSQLLNPLINSAIINFSKLFLSSWSEPIRKLRADLGLRQVEEPLFEGKHSPELVLALFSKIFAQPQPDWLKQTCVTGFPFYDHLYDHQDKAELNSELSEFLDAGSPPIVFTLGSAAVRNAGNFYIESAIAAKELGHRAVLLIGEDERNLPQSLLSDNIVAFDYAPYSKLFPRSTAIVHQGGIGTTAQALRASRPMLIMPYSHDQPNNAARAERLGVARTIKRSEYTAQQAAAELNQLLSEPSYTRRSAEVGRQIQLENGVQIACDAIEAHLKLPNPIHRNQGSRTAGLFG